MLKMCKRTSVKEGNFCFHSKIVVCILLRTMIMIMADTIKFQKLIIYKAFSLQ